MEDTTSGRGGAAESSSAVSELMRALVDLKRTGFSKAGIPFADKRGPGGLRRSEMMLLFTISHMTDGCPEGISVTDLSHRLRVRPPTITRMLDALESSGYIERRPDPHDRRIVRIHLLEKGETFAREGMEHCLASLGELVDYLGEEKTRALAGILDDISLYYSQKGDLCGR